MENRAPRILFCAPGSGSGKTLITCGFLEAVKRLGCFALSFKCGPDYIDPMFHQYVLGVSGSNLDSFFVSGEALRAQIAERFCKEVPDGARAVGVIEGVMGYYDGLGGVSTAAGTYDIARLTGTPAVLVLDCRGASLSLAATVAGFLHYRADSGIKGVILNRISPALYERLVPVIEAVGVKVYGYLPERESFRLESRHLGLVMPEETKRLHTVIEELAGQLSETVDIEGLLALAETAGDLAAQTSVCKAACSLRIGVARDRAFSFYYKENLELMERLGAELVYFSPLTDRALPGDLDGLLLGGGYPELFAKELSENTAMRRAVKAAASGAVPVLAECGGFLYLHRSLEGADDICYDMAGVIEGDGFRTGRLGRFGYITLTAPDGRQIRGHEFHYWDSTAPGTSYEALKPVGGHSWRCMHERKNLLCGFPHLYYPSNPAFLKDWLTLCRENRSRRILGKGRDSDDK